MTTFENSDCFLLVLDREAFVAIVILVCFSTNLPSFTSDRVCPYGYRVIGACARRPWESAVIILFPLEVYDCP